MTVSPTFLSLFSGCGGFDLGFIRAGFRCLGAYDIDTAALAVNKRNLGSPTNTHNLEHGLPVDHGSCAPDVVVAGPPCQGFSTMGARRLDDPRNHLLVQAAQIAISINPRTIVIENVRGARSGTHKKFWDAAATTLRDAGYRVADIQVDCETLGVPQRRRRVLLIAWNTGALVQPTLPQVPGGVIRDVIVGLEGLPNHDPVALVAGTVGAKIAPSIRPGQKLCNVRASCSAVHTWDVPSVYGETTEDERNLLQTLLRERRRNRVRDFGDADPVRPEVLRKVLGSGADALLGSLMDKGYIREKEEHYDLTHTFNGKYRRLRWDDAAPTVDTKFGDPRLFLHPSESRGFTVREAASIQGFPNDFVFEGSTRQQYRMVGNAVPPPTAEIVANWVRNALLNR